MGACTLSAGEMIERHVEIIRIESQAGEHLFDADLIDISAASLKLMLHGSVPDQGPLPFRRVRHLLFESLQLPLHADEVCKRLETHIPEHTLQFKICLLREIADTQVPGARNG